MKKTNYKSFTPIQRLWRLLATDKKEIRNIHIYAIFNGIISLSLPLGIQAIVNLIQGGQINTSWVVLVVFVVLGIAVTGVLHIFQLRITENLQQKIFTRAAFEFSHRISRIRLEAIYKHYAPELMNRFFDITSVQKGLSKILIDFSSAVFIVVFSLLLLSFYHPFFILFSFVLLLLVFAMFKFTVQKGMESSLKESKFKYKVAHWIQELSRTAITFKMAGKTDLPLQRTDKYVENYLSAREDHFAVLVQQFSLMVAFKVIIATAFLAIGGILVMDQEMNIGQFIAAEIMVLIIMAAVEKIALSFESIYDILTALEKIGQVTDLEIDRETGIEFEYLPSDDGIALELHNVGFTFPYAINQTLNGVSLTLEKGEIGVIVGESGSGKSTLLQIIAGLYDIQEGAISFNGLPFGNLSLSSTRETIGDHIAMEQLFEGSVLDNITLGRENATFENVRWAIDNLGLNKFIKSLPEGYNTLLNAQGKGLSEKIVSKLLLARAISHKPKILLIENSFEEFNKPTCMKIIDFLTDKQNKWTIVAVSANEYLAQRADRVILLKNGKVNKIGSYDEMKKNIKL